MFHFKNTLFCFLVLLVSAPLIAPAQVAPRKPTAADIHDAIEKLGVLGSVLYVAAHPDDENTRLISYMASAQKMQTTYLSLTRGDGGQNLIGSELRELLGVLRTQELLMARSVDGGKQMFSRANDFGFSKSPAETMGFWNKQDVLSDVVWAIRKTQPDVVINRFSIDTTVDTHGHHTASAVLSQEAFDLAANPSVFPEQLKYVKVWQPKRLFFNTSWFFYGSREKFDAADKSKMTKIDIGVFMPTKGKSNNEIAAESRSMHKCQGFGSMGTRGADVDYLDYLKGIGKPNNGSIFDGINTTWARVQGGAAIGKLVTALTKEFKLSDPAASLPKLLKIKKLIDALPDSEHWKSIKSAEIQQVIAACTGLYLEASAASATAVPNQFVDVNLEAINRSKAQIVLTRIRFEGATQDTSMALSLGDNQRSTFKFKVKIPGSTPFTAPYWLSEKSSLGMYSVENQALRGLPETPRALKVIFELTLNGEKFSFERPVVHRYENPAKGELYRPFEITPSVFVNVKEKVYVFGDAAPKIVQFVVKAGADRSQGILMPKVPEGWAVSPDRQPFDLKLKGEEIILDFNITAPKGQAEGVVQAQVYVPSTGDNASADFVETPTKALRVIEYDHIPTQTVLQAAEARLVKVDVVKSGTQIGYFMGAGDDMPACLAQIGYQVTDLKENDFQQSAAALSRFDAIVLGIRAYNTKEKLKFYNEKLLEYVKNGGTLVVQYNTSGRDLLLPSPGPFPFKVGRGRTTEEDAKIRILKPEHPIFNKPNKIGAADFDHWVQERGLYFLSEWDKNYEALLSSNDTNEKPENGGLIIAPYGKGQYIYTGYSFFRQLPAGVPGAYRLFANLLSIGR
jgi:LmbE family N-acetylglucosaminyl deacetylase